jgi:hypothetical protein
MFIIFNFLLPQFYLCYFSAARLQKNFNSSSESKISLFCFFYFDIYGELIIRNEYVDEREYVIQKNWFI